jgi:hypothetical protein
MENKVTSYTARVIAKKQLENEHKIKMAVAAYGTVIQRKSDGYILTPEEMVSLANKFINTNS